MILTSRRCCMLMTDCYAVFGDPIQHSRSPWIHRQFAAATGQDIDYQPIHAPAHRFVELLQDFHEGGGQGANITLPLKEIAALQCDSLSAAAHRAGAANTLLRRGASWHGDNTDGSGWMADLARLDCSPAGRRVLILGAGGAARGILGPLLESRPARVHIANRNPERALELALRFRTLGVVESGPWLPPADEFDLIVHASAAAHAGTPVQFPPLRVASGAVAYDLSYGAAARPFLDYAASLGVQARHDGLGMLVEQAADAFALWRGIRPETGSVLAQLRAQVGA